MKLRGVTKFNGELPKLKLAQPGSYPPKKSSRKFVAFSSDSRSVSRGRVKRTAKEVEYYAQLSPHLGARLTTAVERSVALAAEFPGMGVPYK